MRIELDLTTRQIDQLREIMENQSVGRYADLICAVLDKLPPTKTELEMNS